MIYNLKRIFVVKYLRIFLFLTIIAFLLLITTYLLRPQILRQGYNYLLNLAFSCDSYKQDVYSITLDDNLSDYYYKSSSLGVKSCKNENELKDRIKKGELYLVLPGSGYAIEKMEYSYPYLTKSSIQLLEEIENNFKEKISGTRLRKSRVIITSMTRTNEQLIRLRKINHNSSLNSPHLNGNAFDISYIRFKSKRLFLSRCEKKYLMEVLAEVIWQLRRDKECWATFEKNQHCFHIVSR